MAAADGSHVVVALVGRRASPFELGVVHEVFGLHRPELPELRYEFRLVGAFGSPIAMKDSNWSIDTPWTVDDVADADTIVLPGWGMGEDLRKPTPPPILDALRKAHRGGKRLVSVCSGSFVLAEAGLLDSRPATTHWMYTDELADRYPAVKVDPDVLFVDGGDDIFTSAGTGAGIDLCLHIVRLDHGAAATNTVARRMVVPPQRDGGQAQFVAPPVGSDGNGDNGDSLAKTLEWALENLDQPLQVEDLARQALQSPRTFARHFRLTLGTTPMQWLTRQRVIHAQHLLETTHLPVEVIAQQCGLGTGTALRTHFRRITGTSPVAYRRAFQCPNMAVS